MVVHRNMQLSAFCSMSFMATCHYSFPSHLSIYFAVSTSFLRLHFPSVRPFSHSLLCVFRSIPPAAFNSTPMGSRTATRFDGDCEVPRMLCIAGDLRHKLGVFV